MRRHARILMISISCIAVAGGTFFFAESHARSPGSKGAISPNDEALYAEVSVPAAPSQQRTASSTETLRLPILVYHIVRPSYPSDSPAVQAIAHTPEVFDAEMKYLGDAGYHIVSFGDLEDYFRSSAAMPEKPIIISFDDGWSDQFQYAFPILEKYHYTATFFVFTNPIGTKGFITWDELRTMLNAGMHIGSHSRSHPYLTHIDSPAVLWNEIDGSKRVLEKQLGVTINEFAYPFGMYDDDIRATVVEAGYLSARGDRYYKGDQSAGRLYELDALNAPTTMALFAQKFPSSN